MVLVEYLDVTVEESVFDREGLDVVLEREHGVGFLGGGDDDVDEEVLDGEGAAEALDLVPVLVLLLERRERERGRGRRSAQTALGLTVKKTSGTYCFSEDSMT